MDLESHVQLREEPLCWFFFIKHILKLSPPPLSGHIPCWKEQCFSHVVRNTHLANDLMQQGYGMMLFAAISD